MKTELNSLDVSTWQLPAYETHEFAPRLTRYCVCIPVINEGERILQELRDIQQSGIAKQADILILDGGSTDGSMDLDLLRDLGVRTLLIKRGPGKLGAQLRMGYSYALLEGYEGIVTIDGNGKDGVNGIPQFLSAIDSGIDFVQGSRYQPGGEAINTPLIRKIAIKVLHAPILNLASGFHYTDTTNGFRGYSRRLLLDPRLQPFRSVFQTYELLAYLSARAPRLGYKVIEVPVRRSYPATGKIPTKISGFRGNWLLLKILFGVALGRFNPRKPV
jgi:dolichol-phosphate mannosyltransferase